MDIQTTKISSQYRYLSEVMDDLPHNAYIDKQVTGCGGTTLVLTNDQPYVVAVHSKAVIANKTAQHKNILGVTGETTDSEIIQYMMKKSVKKFMVTYDSLPRLMTFIDPSKYRLLVDEVQVLIRYAGEFKIKVCNDLFNSTYKFMSTSFLTATPTLEQYLPKAIQKLRYVKFEWESAIKPSIQNLYVDKDLNTSIISFVLDKLDHTKEEVYIFYNSRVGVARSIKRLMKAEPKLTLNDITVIFAESQGNINYFEKQLGKTFKMGSPIDTSKNKRINFVSSFGFEGVDFYSKNPCTLVVSDSKLKSMRYDIAIDLPQIVGRFRHATDKNIHFIWNTYVDEIKKSEEEFIKEFQEMHSSVYRSLHSNEIATIAAFHTHVKTTHTPHCYIDIDLNGNEVIKVNDYAFESVMSSYSAMHCDYYMIDSENNRKCKMIDEKVVNIFSEINTFEIPKLEPKYIKNLNIKINFSKLCQEYIKIQTILKVDSSNIEAQHQLNEILESSDDLLRYSKVIPLSRFSSLGFTKTSLETEYEILTGLKKISTKKICGLSINSIYTSEEIKHELQEIFIKNNISKKPKIADLKEFYDIKLTTKNNQSAYKIIGIK